MTVQQSTTNKSWLKMWNNPSRYSTGDGGIYPPFLDRILYMVKTIIIKIVICETQAKKEEHLVCLISPPPPHSSTRINAIGYLHVYNILI